MCIIKSINTFHKKGNKMNPVFPHDALRFG